MEFTRTRFQDRLTLLRQERDQAQLTVVAYDGAIQECQYWLGLVTPTIEQVLPGVTVKAVVKTGTDDKTDTDTDTASVDEGPDHAAADSK